MRNTGIMGPAVEATLTFDVINFLIKPYMRDMCSEILDKPNDQLSRPSARKATVIFPSYTNIP